MDELLFNNILSNISNNKNFSIYGFGSTGRLHYKNIYKDINILDIYDRNYVGELVDNITIKEFKQRENDNIILIAATNEFYYMDIHSKLLNLGLVEYKDFFNIREFVPLYYYAKYHRLVVPLVHIGLTTRCTLNCKNCNMFIPSHKLNNTNDDENVDNIINNIDNAFNNIDKIFKIVLLGGEPFLYEEIDKVIDHIMINYSNRVSNLEIFTNGSIIPSNELLEKMKKYNMVMNISDYSSSVNYLTKIDSFENELKKYNIEYRRSKSIQWVDFLFPYSKFNINKKDIKKHMLQCAPAFKGLNDSKFYYCHIVWSAVKAGLIKEDKKDFFDLSKKLTDTDKLNFLKFFFGLPDDHYISLCEYCAGFGKDNKTIINAGIQS